MQMQQTFQYEQPEHKNMEVTMSYVPWQNFEKIYKDLYEAFMSGTIFPQLNKPFYGGRICQ